MAASFIRVSCLLYCNRSSPISFTDHRPSHFQPWAAVSAPLPSLYLCVLFHSSVPSLTLRSCSFLGFLFRPFKVFFLSLHLFENLGVFYYYLSFDSFLGFLDYHSLWISVRVFRSFLYVKGLLSLLELSSFYSSLILYVMADCCLSFLSGCLF